MKILAVILVVAAAVAGGLFLRQNENRNPNTMTNNAVNITQAPTASSQDKKIVPLPTEEDVIRTFFALINEKRIAEAIKMMDVVFVGDESSKQAFGVQYSSLNNIQVKSMEPAMQEEWEQNEKIFKVIVNLQVAESAAKAPVPYYGWENGDNTRFVTVKKIAEGKFKIAAIGTGP